MKNIDYDNLHSITAFSPEAHLIFRRTSLLRSRRLPVLLRKVSASHYRKLLMGWWFIVTLILFFCGMSFPIAFFIGALSQGIFHLVFCRIEFGYW